MYKTMIHVLYEYSNLACITLSKLTYANQTLLKTLKVKLPQKLTALEITLPFINPYPTEFPYGNGMVLHFYQQQESSTTKTVYKVINKGLKA